jgi:hypothetical protein
VSGGIGVLGTCSVFDTAGPAFDYLTLPDGSWHGGSDCPVGVILAPGDALTWQTDNCCQDNEAGWGYDNGCATKGTCGLPYDRSGLGGGWLICFAGGR